MILENGCMRQDGDGTLHIRFNNGRYAKVMFVPTLGGSVRSLIMRDNGDMNESTCADDFANELKEIAELK